MKPFTIVVLMLIYTVSLAQNEKDKSAIQKIIEDQSKGWATKDLELSLKDVDENVDWTNAFGDRMQTRDELRQLLSHIYSLDFVMAGKSENEYNDITFLTPEIAMVRSKTVVQGQKWGDGSVMEDRHNHHLRILQKKDGQWKVISHLISQAWTKK